MFDVVRVILKLKRFSIISLFMYGMFCAMCVLQCVWYVVCDVMLVVYDVCIVMCEIRCVYYDVQSAVFLLCGV